MVTLRTLILAVFAGVSLGSTSARASAQRDLSSTLPRGIRHALTHLHTLKHALRGKPAHDTTQDILAQTIGGKGFDVRFADLNAPPGQAATDITSVRGPNVPLTHTLHPTTAGGGPRGPAGSTPPSKSALGRSSVPAHGTVDKQKMEQEWARFISKKENRLPPLETPKAQHPAVPMHSAPAGGPIKRAEAPKDLADMAMAEYDARARQHRTQDPHRKYLQTVQKLASNADRQNRNVPTPAGTAKTSGKGQHYGYASAMDFIDSFNPFEGGTTDNDSSNRPAAPPIAAAPPLTQGGGGGAPGAPASGAPSSGDGNNLAAQILQTTPTYSYQKLGGSTSQGATSSTSLADQGPFQGERNQQSPVTEQQAPRSRESMMESEAQRALSAFDARARRQQAMRHATAALPVGPV